MNKSVNIVTNNPTVELIASMAINRSAVERMMEWVKSHRPECLPKDPGEEIEFEDLFPHDLTENGRNLSDNELLVELAGRKCYDSFGAKAGKKSNAEYIDNTQAGDVKHSSILYHAKMSFFFAGVSRRVSHEFIRNYVGSDRNEEGSPSQESTRFTHHYGYFIAPPRYVGKYAQMEGFKFAMQAGYDAYMGAIDGECEAYAAANGGVQPKGLDRKRIYEAAAGFLPMQAETSWIWTTNPMALAKLVRERADEVADLEFQRLAHCIARVAVRAAPNLFPQPWMRKYAE
jgi:thymidylate synthase (FAD)